MQKFNSDGVEIAFSDTGGEGPPVLLVHGFASNGRVNWVHTGWERALVEAGFRVIIIDNRGHGESEKLYDEDRYLLPLMADDAQRLLRHLGISRACVMGYSMGARIVTYLAIKYPDMVGKLVIAGLAERLVTGVGGAEEIAAALEAPKMSDVNDEAGRSFRLFAEQTKSDLRALAACMRSTRVKIKAEALAKLKCPTLVVAGTKDDVAGKIEPLLAIIPGARGLSLEGRNHMNAVGDLTFKRTVIGFFKEAWLSATDPQVRSG